jgi:Clostridium epsilon toxin ETX/Bacillus mosquitocidal toxin MTX2
MAYAIDMTLRGVLRDGGWRSESDLNSMSTEDKRNTLIAVLAGSSRDSAGHYQAHNNEQLIGAAAMAIFLRWAEIRDEAGLKTLSQDDQRNVLIIENNKHTDREIRDLQGLSDQQLVGLGLEWLNKRRTISAILEFYWSIDNARIVSSAPDIIESQHYDNRHSSLPLKSSFNVAKEISNQSSFSHEHGFEVMIGASLKFKAGIPVVANSEAAAKVEVSTSHDWKFGEQNATKQSYSHTSAVEVPPHGHVQLVAQITRSALDVPYRAKILASDGTTTWIEGTWNGVATANLIVRQADVDRDS